MTAGTDAVSRRLPTTLRRERGPGGDRAERMWGSSLAPLERIDPPGIMLHDWLRTPAFDGIRTPSRFQRLVVTTRPPGVP